MDEIITSKSNERIKRLTRLMAEKKERDLTGLFVCEGARLCLDILDAGTEIDSVYITEEALLRYPQTARLIEKSASVINISDELARRISCTESPQGVFCICKKLDNSRSAVKIKDGGKYLLLDSLQDPGNLGTVLRTANALGISGVLLRGCPDIYSPKVLRAAMGATARLPICITDDIMETLGILRDAGVRVYAAALSGGAIPVSPGMFDGGAAVLIGNEGAGLPDNLIGMCDGSVIIPMVDGAESLNAAMAAGILMWEMTKPRL